MNSVKKYIFIIIIFGVVLGLLFTSDVGVKDDWKSYDKFRSNATTTSVSTVEAMTEDAKCAKPDYKETEMADNSQFVCFKCDKAQICYEYRSFDNGQKKLTDLKSNRMKIEGDIDENQEMNIRSHGIAEKLECSCGSGKCVCREGIKIEKIDNGIYYHEEKKGLIGQKSFIKLDLAEKLDRQLGGGNCTKTSSDSISCEKIKAHSLEKEGNAYLEVFWR